MVEDLFHFDSGKKSFEDCATENGVTHWSEDLLREALGYESEISFSKAITRAKKACLSLNLHCEDHFLRGTDGKHALTRFACYLVAMNGDPSKPEVAKAQAYFATLAETFQTHLEHAEAIDRVLIRDEVADGQKAMQSTAKSHGVTNYAFFQSKGYMGMYNMTLPKLLKYKGLKEDDPLIDYMGKTELAAHLFRITQTTEKIRRDGIRGQSALESTAYGVGRQVRKTMEELGGSLPEDLPASEKISEVKKKLKGTNKKLKDSKKNRNNE